MSVLDELHQLYKRVEVCQDCALGKYRTRAVPGEGPENAEIIFIGEGPGWHEDQQGRPFVGPAGQFLNELLVSIGLQRDKVYITNVVKCRPPGNRDPLPGEIKECSKYLDQQIELIKPRMIVTLGRYSMARYFPNESISKVHGTSKRKDNVIYFAMYHPAAALHQGNLRKTIEADMLKIPQLLSGAVDNSSPPQEKPEEEKPKPKQLNLFEQ